MIADSCCVRTVSAEGFFFGDSLSEIDLSTEVQGNDVKERVP
jgi:hypothetical protein